jgi:hypothetical protein
MKNLLAPILFVVATTAQMALAQTTYQAVLAGPNEVPPNGTPGTGLGTVVLNSAQTQITVDLNWSGMIAPATGSFINGPAPPGFNGPLQFALAGTPPTNSGSIFEQTFPVSPSQVSFLQGGGLYMNIESLAFAGGEIRGQLNLVSFTLTLTTNGGGGITQSPPGSPLASGTSVTLTATPDTNWTFSGWSGNVTGTNNPLTFPLTNNMAITGDFTFMTNGVAAAIALAAQISWFAPTGQHYQVQGANVLASNVWFNLGSPVAGNNATNFYYDPFGTNRTRFYRVMTRP